MRKLFHKKYFCWKLYRQFRSKELLAKYKLVSQACSKGVKDYIAQCENNLISNGKLGNFYKYVNQKLNGSNGVGPLRNTNGQLESTNDAKATLLTTVLVVCSP